MAEIIQLHKKSTGREDDLITARPLEFRRAPWKSSHFIQVTRSDWRGRNSLELDPPVTPPHFVLQGSLADTVLGLYTHRENEDRMKEVYYIAGLIDCLVNQVNPLLRTFLINDIYKKVSQLKKALNLNWYGHIDRILLPLAPGLYDQEKYREGISCSRTLKDLYFLIMQGTGEMFDILSQEYIFFTPGDGA